VSAPEAGIEADRAVLEVELGLLQAEISELNAELERRALRERFAGALERIDQRMVELGRRHERIRALLTALAPENTPPPERR
jgi:hypothetical protein